MSECKIAARERPTRCTIMLFPSVLVILSIFSISISLLLPMEEEDTHSLLARSTAQAAASVPKDFFEYNNPNMGLKIQYPPNWHALLSNGNNTIQFFPSSPENSSDNFFERISIYISPAPLAAYPSLAALTNKTNSIHSEFTKEFKIGKSNDITIKNNTMAKETTYTFVDPHLGMMKGMDILAIKGSRMYAIQYYAPVQKFYFELPTMQRMIDSLQILNAEDRNKAPVIENENEKNRQETYANAMYGISMNYPSSWKMEEIDLTPRDYDIDVVQFYSHGSCNKGVYNAEINITIRIYRDENTPQNAGEELEYVIDRGNLFSSDFKVVESSANVTLAGYPAYKIVWSEVIDDIPEKVMEMGTVIGGDVYVAEYRALPESYLACLPTAQQMVNSLRIDGTFEQNSYALS